MDDKQLTDKTMSFTAANVWGTLIAVLIFFPFLAIHWWVWGESFWSFLDTIEVNGLILVLLVIALFLSIAVHELLHGVGYNLGGASWSQIKFGLHSMTPYAHCKVPLDVTDYRFAVALPGVLLGLAPTIGGLFSGSMPILLYGLFMASSAAGDLLILWVLRDVPEGWQVLDHPSKIGCQVYQLSPLDTP